MIREYIKIWNGQELCIKSAELKKTVYGPGYQAGKSRVENLVKCPPQTYPTKYQRVGCSRMTDENTQRLPDKIVDLSCQHQQSPNWYD